MRAWIVRRRPARVGGLAILAALWLVHPVTGQDPDSAATTEADSTLLLSPPALPAGQIDGSAARDADEPVDTVTLPVPLSAEALEHLSHLAVSFPDTPNGDGLLPTAMAEAAIAAEHVRRAGRDSTDVGAMRRNMTHVLHAIDPDQVAAGAGAGMGYGFKRAAQGVATHIELAVEASPEHGALSFHAPHIVRGARGAAQRADDAIALAREIQRSFDAREAHRMVERLDHLVRAMAYGDDRDGDGRIGWAPSESGLAQAIDHLNLLRRMEGLPDVERGPRRAF